jgi:hypothetical protein
LFPYPALPLVPIAAGALQAEAHRQYKVYAEDRAMLTSHAEALLASLKHLEHEKKAQKAALEKELAAACTLSSDAEAGIMRAVIGEFDAAAAAEVASAEERVRQLMELAERLVAQVASATAAAEDDDDDDEAGAEGYPDAESEQRGGRQSRPRHAHADDCGDAADEGGSGRGGLLTDATGRGGGFAGRAVSAKLGGRGGGLSKRTGGGAVAAMQCEL